MWLCGYLIRYSRHRDLAPGIQFGHIHSAFPSCVKVCQNRHCCGLSQDGAGTEHLYIISGPSQNGQVKGKGSFWCC